MFLSSSLAKPVKANIKEWEELQSDEGCKGEDNGDNSENSGNVNVVLDSDKGGEKLGEKDDLGFLLNEWKGSRSGFEVLLYDNFFFGLCVFTLKLLFVFEIDIEAGLLFLRNEENPEIVESFVIGIWDGVIGGDEK